MIAAIFKAIGAPAGVIGVVPQFVAAIKLAIEDFMQSNSYDGGDSGRRRAAYDRYQVHIEHEAVLKS